MAYCLLLQWFVCCQRTAGYPEYQQGVPKSHFMQTLLAITATWLAQNRNELNRKSTTLPLHFYGTKKGKWKCYDTAIKPNWNTAVVCFILKFSNRFLSTVTEIRHDHKICNFPVIKMLSIYLKLNRIIFFIELLEIPFCLPLNSFSFWSGNSSVAFIKIFPFIFIYQVCCCFMYFECIQSDAYECTH